MKTITINGILALGPCSRYDCGRLKKLFGRKRKASLADVCRAKIPLGDRIWLAIKGPWLDDRQRRLFACDCAERVLPIYEKKYPDDKRPRNAVEVARRFAEGQATDEELAAAGDAAGYAARDAAWAAAGDAAGYAAGYAARDAAWAAAWAAAGDVAGDAARAAALEKFLRWGLKRIQEYANGKHETAPLA